MQKHARLSGIVRVVGVVDKAHMGFYPTPYLQLQAVVQPIKAIVQGIVKAVHARYFVATSCPIFKVSHVSRVRDELRKAAPFALALGLRDITEVGTCVMFGRKISV